MTDEAMLQGTFWPTLNPNYTANPKAEPVPQVANSFNTVPSNELTAEFLVREAINRGWNDIHGRLGWYMKDDDGNYTAEVRLQDGWEIVNIPASEIDS